MTRQPSSPLARAALDALDRLDALQRRGDKTPPPVAVLRRRLTTALTRLEAGRPIPDGLNRSGGSRRRLDADDLDDVRLTPTEAAANARGFSNRPNDPVHQHGYRAASELIRAITSLDNCLAALDALDRLTDEAPIDTPACELCAGVLTNPRPWEHYGDVGGRLPKPMHLCKPHRQYVEDRGAPPTPEQTRHHDTTGRWRIRTTA